MIKHVLPERELPLLLVKNSFILIQWKATATHACSVLTEWMLHKGILRHTCDEHKICRIAKLVIILSGIPGSSCKQQPQLHPAELTKAQCWTTQAVSSEVARIKVERSLHTTLTTGSKAGRKRWYRRSRLSSCYHFGVQIQKDNGNKLSLGLIFFFF